MTKKPGPKPNPRLRALAGGDDSSLHDSVYRAAPDPPDDLSGPALEVFQRAVQQLDPVGLLTKADGPALTLAARMYAIAMLALDELEADGVTTTDEAHGGEARKHPAWQVAREAALTFERFGSDFGLTPRSRHQLPSGVSVASESHVLDGPSNMPSWGK